MRELALFAGSGGGILGGAILGWRTICAVELEPYAASVLVARQNDGILPPFPIWDDIRDFDGRPWRGRVDVVSGGFPCQDISAAGRGAGIEGERSGLWSEMFRVICEVRPRFVLVENSPMLASRGLGRVLGDLASVGFNAEWDVFGADDVGAPHIRKRMWILAYDTLDWHADGDNDMPQPKVCGGAHAQPGGVCEDVADSNCQWELQSGGTLCESRGWTGDGGTARDFSDAAGDGWHALELQAGELGEAMGQAPERQSGRAGGEVSYTCGIGCDTMEQADGGGEKSAGTPGSPLQFTFDPGEQGWWGSEPAVGRMADGVAHRVDRLTALGNGQVPMVAAMAFRVLHKRLLGYEWEGGRS